MEKENNQNEIHDEHLNDHNYDGIEELDNPPPRWIMALFYLTIGISIIYGAYYFWLDVGDHQDEEYANKSERHDQKYQVASLSTADLNWLTDETSLNEGKTIYSEMSCFACHGMNGEGNAIGPNLTDEYFIHGCDFESVFNIIKNGVPAKGMTAFKGQISDEKIQKVSSFVHSLKGTNPANAKAAQGEKCE
jgi:cytochrome c oxidase cbb3-type subunit III